MYQLRLQPRRRRHPYPDENHLFERDAEGNCSLRVLMLQGDEAGHDLLDPTELKPKSFIRLEFGDGRNGHLPGPAQCPRRLRRLNGACLSVETLDRFHARAALCANLPKIVQS